MKLIGSKEKGYKLVSSYEKTPASKPAPQPGENTLETPKTKAPKKGANRKEE